MLLTSCTSLTPPRAPVTVFADDGLYQSHSETEFSWYGTLEAVNRTLSDSGLFYSLAYGKKARLIYTGSVIPELELLVGEEVIIWGKLVGTRDYAPIATGSELWPATIAAFEAQLVECFYEGEPAEPERKLSPRLKLRLAEEPGEAQARIISFCDNIEITPYFDVDELTELRAPLYARLERELKPYSVEVLDDSNWLVPSLTVKIPLNQVLKVAERPDTISLDDTEETAPPP